MEEEEEEEKEKKDKLANYWREEVGRLMFTTLDRNRPRNRRREGRLMFTIYIVDNCIITTVALNIYVPCFYSWACSCPLFLFLFLCGCFYFQPILTLSILTFSISCSYSPPQPTVTHEELFNGVWPYRKWRGRYGRYLRYGNYRMIQLTYPVPTALKAVIY